MHGADHARHLLVDWVPAQINDRVTLVRVRDKVVMAATLRRGVAGTRPCFQHGRVSFRDSINRRATQP